MKQLPVIQLTLMTTLILTLFGCTQPMTTDSQSVGAIEPSVPAVYQNQQHQIHKPKVITRYVPVAVPGQLMPISQLESTKGKAPSFLTRAKAVEYANKHAMITPNSGDFFNAMTTYNYMPGALYTIYTAPMRITDIVFEPGEKIISDAAGDTLRWQVSQTYSGEGGQTRQHILVKPNKSGMTNTMIVTTNRRVYHLVLKSTNNHTYMVSTRWHYPRSMVTQGELKMPLGHPENSSGSPYEVNVSNLHFDYKFGMVKGQKPTWYPVRVFTNSRQTFIQFSKAFSTSNTPALYVADNNGHYGTMVNWRLKGQRMIVDTIIHKARLQTGTVKTGQTIVQIQQT